MKSKYMSIERKKYLSDLRNHKLRIFLAQIFILAFFLILWEFLANKEIIDSFITSKPSKILSTFMNLSQNDLLKHVLVTTYETIVGFLLGTLLGILIAILLWWSDFLANVFEPYLVVLNSLPKVALRSSYYNLGWSWYTCNYCYGNSYFTCCNYIRKFEWIFENRQRSY